MGKRNVAITGANGQLGRALLDQSPSSWEIHAITRETCDIQDWRSVRDCFASVAPNLVIHAAAATDVDGCERDPDYAYAVNALGTRNVASAAASVGAQTVYISTNYVFDGRKSAPYHEFDPTNPLSVYGASKLAGEVEARSASTDCYVIRTGMLYAREGTNFVNTMRRLMSERDELRVVDDQRGNPTYAPDLAAAITEIIDLGPPGTYHAVNSDSASWYDWATEIARLTGATTRIEPIPASEFPRDAEPPANGMMLSLALPSLGIELPDWRDALGRAVTE